MSLIQHRKPHPHKFNAKALDDPRVVKLLREIAWSPETPHAMKAKRIARALGSTADRVRKALKET